MRHMVVMPELTGYASIRRVAVSLPYVAQLIDGKKYMLPGDVKPPEGGTERRRQRAPRERAYRAGAAPHWIKVKNPKHPAINRVKDIHGLK